ncbi:hypothetical protein [Consotaella aegiceratis]|uniref:hypothetical protein n=1 Tax=Consotaella aegiceratis TaxID=3097961 RepID=UPI002F405E81
MKKLLAATAFVAMMIPAASFAQDTDYRTDEAYYGAMSRSGDLAQSGTLSTMEAPQDFTIIKKNELTTSATSGDSSSTPYETIQNDNVESMKTIRDQIAANPGLSKALSDAGVDVSTIEAIDVLPSNQVVVYTGS